MMCVHVIMAEATCKVSPKLNFSDILDLALSGSASDIFCDIYIQIQIPISDQFFHIWWMYVYGKIWIR